MTDYNQKLRDAEKVIQNINEHIRREEREEDKLILKRNSLQSNIRTLEAELKDLTENLEKIKRIKEKYEIEIRTEENKIKDAKRMLEK